MMVYPNYLHSTPPRTTLRTAHAPRRAQHSTFPRTPHQESTLNQPQLRTDVVDDAYTVRLSPPPDCSFESCNASLDRQGRLVLNAIVQTPPSHLFYLVRRRALIYSRPSHHHVAGVVEPGTRLRGTHPSPHGWIKLASGYMVDDGSLALAAPAKPGREDFSKTLPLPSDAQVDEAVGEETPDGALLVKIPRKRAPRPSLPCRSSPPHVSEPARRAKPAVPRPAGVPQPTKPSVRSDGAPRSAAPRARRSQHHDVDGRPAAVPSDSGVKKPKRPAAKRALPSSARLTPSDPVLREAPSSPDNISLPEEADEEWRATSAGGFELA